MQPADYQEFYTKESSVYHTRRYGGLYGKIFQHLHHNVLAECLKPFNKKDNILEIACGTGHTSALLVALGLKPISCDLTPAMMRQAREKTAGKPNQPDFVQADATRLPFPDNSFDALISTRFLHLFQSEKQREIIQEMHRVLKPGGSLIIDFDNWSSRWIMSIPYLFYNIIKYSRAAPFSIYNRINPTSKMIEEIGFNVNPAIGIGGTHLIALGIFSFPLAIKAGLMHRKLPLRILAEQFVINSIKR